MTHVALPPFSGAVLCGGASRRMGTDKALVAVGPGGRPLASVALAALRAAGAVEVAAVGGDRPGLAALGFSYVADRHPGEGPLGGLVSALAAAPCEVVAVLACDLPDVEAGAVRAVVAALGDAAIAVPVVDGRLQVLLAAYHRRCLPHLEAAFAAGVRAVHRALAGLDVRTVELAEPRWARNVNRPGDLGAAG
jgi:molybdopterin-guanine dinucleotide biosynthesis protein A